MAKAIRQQAAGYSPRAAARFVRLRAGAMLKSGEAASRFGAERKALVEWICANSLVLSDDFFIELKAVSAGAEHTVYHSAQNSRAIKICHANRYGHSVLREGAIASPLEYLTRLAYSNLFFGDDLRLLGAFLTNEELQIVSSQPWITANESSPTATWWQIEDYFGRLGFRKSNQFGAGSL